MFYAALKAGTDLLDEERINGGMLRNLLDGLKAVGAPLQRVVHYQGAKVYGVHLGHARAPFYEDDPRHLTPNFYYAQEDLLRERGAAGEFDWAILRPDVVVGDIAGNPMNIVMVMGVLGARVAPRGRRLRHGRGPPQPFSLAKQMPLMGAAWQDLSRRHGLQTAPIEKLVGWWFGDFVFNTEFDMVSDMGKIRRAGFTEAVEAEATVVAAIERLRESKQLP